MVLAVKHQEHFFFFYTYDYRGVFKWFFTQFDMDYLMANASILENKVADGRFKMNYYIITLI